MNTTLGQLLAQRAKLSPRKEALASPDGRWTFSELNERSHRLAAHLAAHGVSTGDRVAVYAKNGEFISSALFAVARLGAALVVLNWRLQGAELSYILDDSSPIAFLYESAFEVSANDLLEKHEFACVVVHGAAQDQANSYDHVLTAPENDYTPKPVSSDAPAVIMYTSGTTGRPKGAVLSHGALVSSSIGNSSTIDWHGNHRFLLVAPMFHIGGLSPLITNVLKGTTTILLPDFDPVQVWQTIAKERVTAMMTVPLMLQGMLVASKKMTVDLTSLQWITCGASAVPKQLIETWLRLGVHVQQVYGITEFGGAVSFWSHEMDIQYAHSQGKPMFLCEAKVVHPETFEDLAPGTNGEIWVRGAMLFSGYWNNAEATEAALRDGWYRSGDVGHFDEQGFLYVVDRLKDMIISGGENIYPAELEAVIATLAGVAEVAVVGRPDERWGEVPIAFIVRRPDTETSEEDVMTICRQNLAGYKCVKGVHFVDALPRSPVGKVLKRQLKV